MRTRKLLAGGLVATMAVAGCNGGDLEQEWLTVTDPPSPPARTPTPPAPTPTETPTVTDPPTATEEPTASSREQDLLDIAEAAQAFQDIRSAIRAQEEPLVRLNDIAADEAHDLWHRVLEGSLEAGHTQVGAPTLEVVHVDWTNEDRVTIQVCLDVTDVDVIDQDGNSLVPSDRVTRPMGEQDLRRATSSQAEYRWTIIADRITDIPCDD